MCIKKGRDISLLFFGGEERGNKLQRHLTNFLLGQHHPIGASVLFGCTCFVHIPAQLREKKNCPQGNPLVSFLDMLRPGIDAMT